MCGVDLAAIGSRLAGFMKFVSGSPFYGGCCKTKILNSNPLCLAYSLSPFPHRSAAADPF
jgi:hypothetical protein